MKTYFLITNLDYEFFEGETALESFLKYYKDNECSKKDCKIQICENNEVIHFLSTKTQVENFIYLFSA